MSWEPILSWLLDNVIALLALIIAGWSAIYTYRHSGKSLQYTGKSLELQEEAFKMEKRIARENASISKKAVLEAELMESGGSGPIKIDRLRFTNRGKAVARNVRIFIDSVPLQHHPDLQNRDRLVQNQLKIESGLIVNFVFKKEFDLKKPVVIRMIWDDAAGKDNEEILELEL